MALMSVPTIVQQALDDTTLSPRTRAVMWFLSKHLDHVEWTPVKAETICKMAHVKPPTCSRALKTLHRRGYIDVRPFDRRLREFRLPLTKRPPKPKPKREPPTEQGTLFGA